MNDLPTPYESADPIRELSRLSADIPFADKDLIKHICPKKGILNLLTQNFFHAICQNLRKNNITYYSPDNEHYLTQLILRGCATIESTEQATYRNVSRRIEGTHTDPTGDEQQLGQSEEADK